MIPIVIVLGILAFVAMWIGSYKVVEVILTAIVVFMGVVFFVTASRLQPDWGAIATGLFVPTLPEEGSKGILTAVGLIGTTIVPYNLFLHASGASERFKDPEQVSDARFDTVLSIGLGGIISMAHPHLRRRQHLRHRTVVTEWQTCLKNDFEPHIFAAHPEIAAAKASLLDAGAVYAAMSGSGSAVFGLFDDEEKARSRSLTPFVFPLQ